MKLRKYSEKDLRRAVKQSKSIRETLKILGVKPEGGNYTIFHKAVSYFQIDTSHFTGQCWNKGQKFPSKTSVENIKSGNHGLTSHKLRLRLLKEDIFPHQCSACLLTSWRDKPIPLELEHINGDNKDNRLKNLCLLCPNCHAQTPTYRRSKGSFSNKA